MKPWHPIKDRTKSEKYQSLVQEEEQIELIRLYKFFPEMKWTDAPALYGEHKTPASDKYGKKGVTITMVIARDGNVYLRYNKDKPSMTLFNQRTMAWILSDKVSNTKSYIDLKLTQGFKVIARQQLDSLRAKNTITKIREESRKEKEEQADVTLGILEAQKQRIIQEKKQPTAWTESKVLGKIQKEAEQLRLEAITKSNILYVIERIDRTTMNWVRCNETTSKRWHKIRFEQLDKEGYKLRSHRELVKDGRRDK